MRRMRISLVKQWIKLKKDLGSEYIVDLEI